MLVGLFSDTHDHVPRMKQAVDKFKEAKVELVLHCGDFCSPFMIPELEGLEGYAVLGNNDGDLHLLQQKCRAIGFELMGGFGELELDDNKVALYHGTYSGITQSLIASGRYDIVISGHTHEYICERNDGTLVLNPGTTHGFGKSGTAMIINTENLNVKQLHLDAEW
jgi:putative phosphoesterase